jgi:Zn ribbon nucleic-acid-binding protein
MTNFITHEGCPKCGSKDNLGVWEDGHKWCFGCGYFVPRDGVALNEIENRILKHHKKKNKYHDLTLPADFTRDLPVVARQWLNKYGITQQEIQQYGFGWSQLHERLIFPAFDNDGSLSFYQGRAFSDTPDKPRYSTQGYGEDVFHFVGSPSLSVVLTEDVISAIKVSRQAYSMPLWGSHISTERALRLSRLVKEVKIWLDKDKAQYAIRAKDRILPYFQSVQVIISELDPKEYSNESICEFLSIAS